MSELIKRNNLANNADFRTKLKIAAIKAAPFVLDSVERRAEHAYFRHIIAAPNDEGWLTPLAFLAAQNAAIFLDTLEDGTNNSPDGDIQYTVESEIKRLSVPS